MLNGVPLAECQWHKARSQASLNVQKLEALNFLLFNVCNAKPVGNFENTKIWKSVLSRRFYATVKMRQCWKYGLSREFIQVGIYMGGNLYNTTSFKLKEVAMEISPRARVL